MFYNMGKQIFLLGCRALAAAAETVFHEFGMRLLRITGVEQQ